MWMHTQPTAVKLVLWRHWIHVTQVHTVTAENQFNGTRLYNRVEPVIKWTRNFSEPTIAMHVDIDDSYCLGMTMELLRCFAKVRGIRRWALLDILGLLSASKFCSQVSSVCFHNCFLSFFLLIFFFFLHKTNANLPIVPKRGRALHFTLEFLTRIMPFFFGGGGEGRGDKFIWKNTNHSPWKCAKLLQLWRA